VPEPVHPGDLPPDASPEYAAAYRRAYERALREESVEDTGQTQRLAGLDELDGLLVEAPREEYAGPTHRGEDAQERPGWLVPALLGGMVVLLLAAAYGMGAFFSTAFDSGTGREQPEGVVMSEDGTTGSGPSDDEPSSSASPEQDASAADVYEGRTEAASITGGDASCESPPSRDAAGNPVRYEPGNAYDGDLTTAWRCPGDGVGQTLTLSLGGSVEVGQLGIVPGYAKTDPRNGVDRYAENNRLTKVRWTFSDGSSVEQTLDGAAGNRSLQTIALPLTATDQVTLEVLASARGPRNTIAVSEVRIGAAAG
jgi:hypothetical protein